MYPTLRVTDGVNTMMTITDRGSTGDLAVTGSGLFGGPTALGTRSLTVQSANEARMEVRDSPPLPSNITRDSPPLPFGITRDSPPLPSDITR